MIDREKLKNLWLFAIKESSPQNPRYHLKSPQFEKGNWRIAAEHQKNFRSVVIRWIGPQEREPKVPNEWYSCPNDVRKGWPHRVKITPSELPDLIGKLVQFEKEQRDGLKTPSPNFREVLSNIPNHEGYLEGDKLFRRHKSHERSTRLVKEKKATILMHLGRLECEVCQFDFAVRYSERGKYFTECHHIVPLSMLAFTHRTKLSDLAIICANCHRMLHRRPMMTLEQLRAILNIPRDKKAQYSGTKDGAGTKDGT